MNHVTFEEVDTEFLATTTPIQLGSTLKTSPISAFADVSWLDGDNPDGLLLGASGVSEVSLPTNIVFADLFDMVHTHEVATVYPLV